MAIDVGLPDLAGRLNYLFATVSRPGGKGNWNNDSAAAEMATYGVSVSAAYLSQLRTGKRDNPSARHLSGLARLFQVPMEYFVDPQASRRFESELLLLNALRDSRIEGIALRARGLSAEALTSVEGIIDHMRKLEKLPAVRA